MDPIAFGPPSWIFIHVVPFLFPKEVLSKKDSQNVLRFLGFFVDLLPCNMCRKNSLEILKKFPIWKNLIIKIDSKKIIITRQGLLKWIYNFHNLVNEDIKKPKIQLNIEEYNNKVYSFYKYDKEKWLESMFMFLFSICSIFPETREEANNVRYKYRIFLIDIIPNLLIHVDIGNIYNSALKEFKPIEGVFIRRMFLLKWIYEIYEYFFNIYFYLKRNEEIWSFSELNILLDALTSKQKTACQAKIACEI